MDTTVIYPGDLVHSERNGFSLFTTLSLSPERFITYVNWVFTPFFVVAAREPNPHPLNDDMLTQVCYVISTSAIGWTTYNLMSTGVTKLDVIERAVP